MKRWIFAVLLVVLALAGCTPAEPEADQALRRLEERLVAADLVQEGPAGEAGEQLAWAQEEMCRVEISRNSCYAMTLYDAEGEENGVMAGRQYGVFAVSKDGEHFYRYNAAADAWEEI